MKYLTTLSKPATILLLDTSQWILLFAGYIVFMGIWGEIKYEDGPRHRLSAYIVLLGIFAELAANAGVFFGSKQLQNITDFEVSQLSETTAIANKRAAQLEMEALNLRRSLNEQIEINSPRRIDPEKQRRI